MFVIVTKNDGTKMRGIKCGAEGAFLYLVNPWIMRDDEETGGFLESPLGEDMKCGLESIRVVLVPISDIELIESAQ